MGAYEIREVAVDEFTTPICSMVQKETLLPEILSLMVEKEIRHVPVMENNKAIGIISERDVRMVQNIDGSEKFRAEEFMTPDPFTVEAGTSLEEVAFQLSKNKIGSTLVLDSEGKVSGIFTVTDALNALIEVLRGEAG